MSAFGYVIGGRRTAGDSISGLNVALKIDGRVIHDAPAKHGFGTVLASLMPLGAMPMTLAPGRATNAKTRPDEGDRTTMRSSFNRTDSNATAA